MNMSRPDLKLGQPDLTRPVTRFKTGQPVLKLGGPG